MRLAYYAGVSTAAAAACLLKAFHERPNFYSATVYLSQSNACLLIITNLLLVCAAAFMYGLQRVLYGPLRALEIEQLSEKAWYAVLDTLLAMPSFREEVGGWLLTMAVLLLAGKVWGWIGEGRVDVLEQQPPANPLLFHARLSTSLLFSVLFDVWMLSFCVESIIADPRPGIMVIFSFEFAILSISSLFTFTRYVLSVHETFVIKRQTEQAIEVRKSEIRAERVAAAAEAARQMETAGEEGQSAAPPAPDDSPIDVDENEVDVPGWEEKRRYLFGLELLTDFIKLTIYILFFVVSITFNGLPMHIMRDVYMTFASFSKRVVDFIAYRKATSEMNTRYPDATTEEIRGDSCIVCREEMVAWEQPQAPMVEQPAGEQAAPAPAPARQRNEGLRAKKLPCGHILHLRCLKAWLERQQVCPTCRRPVVSAAAPGGTAAAAGNGQPGQAGQAGHPPAPAPPRARMWNLGPLRVAFLNGQNEQLRNILNDIQNPNGAANNNAPPGANHQGANPQPAGVQPAAPALAPRRATVPLNIQLLQLEHRIMVEAHNLGLQQQQLAHLQNMEAELARLRAQTIPAQPPVGTNGAPRPGAAEMPMGFGMPAQAPPHEQLTGIATQQYGAGHEHLPEGVTIPEGWSVMPLRRIGALNDTAAQYVAHSPQVPTVVDSATATAATQHDVAEGNPGPANESTTLQNTVADGNAGPTDESGSPLFIATEAAPINTDASAPTAVTTEAIPPRTLDTATSESAPDPSSISSHIPAPAQEGSSAPWAANTASWGFSDQPSSGLAPEEANASSASQEEENSSGQAREAREKGSSAASEGQSVRKEVQVEEVPDSGA
jgi:E3 ubiquitin-protein ligase synoviolin